MHTGAQDVVAEAMCMCSRVGELSVQGSHIANVCVLLICMREVARRSRRRRV